MKHVFIINPVSGIGNYKRVVVWVEKHFASHDFDIHITKYQGHATEIARQYEKDAVLYSVGGDGTAFEVVNGMSFENEFCVIPVGTGNDFFKMIDHEGELEELLNDTVLNGKVTNIDLGQVNDHYFLNCANIGVDADINALANEMKGKILIPRMMIYVTAALREVVRMKPVRLSIFNDDFKIDKEITLLSIMNGRYYGSGFKSAPKAKLDDGLLDVCIVEGLTRRRAMKLIPKYAKGEHENIDVVEFKHVDNLQVKSEKEVIYGCDGEVFKGKQLNIKLHKGKLKYRMPANA